MPTLKPKMVLATAVEPTDQVTIGKVTIDVERTRIRDDKVTVVGSNIKTGREITRELPAFERIEVQRVHLNREEKIKAAWTEVQRLYGRMPYGGMHDMSTRMRQAINDDDELGRVEAMRETMERVNGLLRRLADESRTMRSTLDQQKRDMEGFRRVLGIDEVLAKLAAPIEPTEED